MRPTFWRRFWCVLFGGHHMAVWNFNPTPRCLDCGWQAEP